MFKKPFAFTRGLLLALAVAFARHHHHQPALAIHRQLPRPGLGRIAPVQPCNHSRHQGLP